jgi:outer membrane protein OmpA-like peptidoglycan-associated protein
VSATFDEVSLAPGVRTVSIQPRVVLARIVGAMFETSKVFLLPSAKPSLKSMGALYREHAKGKVLIVGHADRAGSGSYNAQLSLERADALLAYLRGDVDAWLAWYGQGKPDDKRWGAREDRTMLRSFQDGADLFATPDPIARYRETRGVSETGPTGPATRKALVTEYMATDSESLPADIETTTHGCGEHFPAVETPDGVAEEENRRVELFFFDGEFGILPAPKGKNSNAGSEEYPEWRRRAQQTHDFDVRLGFSRLLRLTLLDSEHEPLANMKWSILHDFGQEEGVTDGDGKLVARLPQRLENTVLVHELGSVQLSLAQLDPVEQLSGLQKRLRNLGYDCTTSGEMDDATRQAVAEFQIDEELEATGEPNAETRERLRALYGH